MTPKELLNMAGYKVNKIKFLSIAALLRDTQLKQSEIAARHRIGQTTVSNVNLAGTWGNYLAHKRAPRPLRSAPVTHTQSSYERARSAGLRPTTRQERVLKSDLKTLDHTPSRSEFKELERRVTIISTQLAGISETPFIGGMLRRRMAKAIQRLPKEQD